LRSRNLKEIRSLHHSQSPDLSRWFIERLSSPLFLPSTENSSTGSLSLYHPRLILCLSLSLPPKSIFVPSRSVHPPHRSFLLIQTHLFPCLPRGQLFRLFNLGPHYFIGTSRSMLFFPFLNESRPLIIYLPMKPLSPLSSTRSHRQNHSICVHPPPLEPPLTKINLPIRSFPHGEYLPLTSERSP